ncbi:uncharacterized protein LOC126898796 [Daktulosphaira vitifoliae]|uniref:uncharacterized protein LOC126898796 n=1 Tax=Daktulosphaira vitifoliae TaxID=58002 RepID=UPI0021AAA234|nr:uncharacterized protein LOC126898796 [Daktulosphaira vitifoliae]
MRFKLITIIIFTIFLVCNSKVCCTLINDSYEFYLMEVIKHLLSQPGWNSIQHLSLIIEDDERIDVNKLLNEMQNYEVEKMGRYSVILNTMFNFIYCRHTEIMLTFDHLLKIIIAKCSSDVQEHKTEEFIFCAKQLHQTVIESLEMFTKLWEVTSFLDSIALNSLEPSLIKMVANEGEIATIIKYVQFKNEQPRPVFIDLNNKISTDVALDEYKDIKRFHDNTLTLKLKDLMTRNSSLCFSNNDFVSSILESLFKINMTKSPTTNINGDIQNIQEYRSVFYQQIIKNDYYNFGFEKLINPQHNKEQIIPSPESSYMFGGVVLLLTKLLSHAGWREWNHIQIKNLDVSNINTRRPFLIGYDNGVKTQSFVYLLIKCRYGEILKNFKVIVTTIINVTKNKIIKNNYSFIDDVISIRDAVKNSGQMLSLMLFALNIIRNTLPHQYKREKKLQLEILIEKIKIFINAFEMYNYSASDFNMEVAHQYLEKLFIFFRADVDKLIYDILNKNYRFGCVINKKYLTTYNLLENFNYSLDLNSSNYNSAENIVLQLCQYLNTFCNNVIQKDFIDLGFNKFLLHPQQYLIVNTIF